MRSGYLPDLPPEDPWELATAWLPGNDDPVRPLMTLATADAGAPDARTVLLSGFDREGFVLHTDARSRKVAQLQADPRVALVIHVAADAHQLVVLGRAEPAGGALDRAAYARRSPYLQQLAWQNTPEFATLPRAERQASWTSFADHRPDGFAAPPSWIGFRVRPSRLTFWQGDPDSSSRRIEYTADAGRWRAALRAG